MFCLLALLVGPRAENAFEGAWAVVGKAHSCTTKHPCAWQEFGAAKRLRDLSIDAQEFVQAQWKKAVLANNTEQIKQWRAELKDAEAKVAKAEAKVEKAQQKYDAERLKEEEAKVSAAPAQAGGLVRFCVCRCCCGVWFAAFPHGRRAFRAVHRFSFLGSCHSSLYNLSSMCWLAALRGVRGAFGVEGSWLLQLQANLVALRVLPTLQNRVSVLGSRWGGQPARFALALQVAVVFV